MLPGRGPGPGPPWPQPSGAPYPQYPQYAEAPIPGAPHAERVSAPVFAAATSSRSAYAVPDPSAVQQPAPQPPAQRRSRLPPYAGEMIFRTTETLERAMRMCAHPPTEPFMQALWDAYCAQLLVVANTPVAQWCPCGQALMTGRRYFSSAADSGFEPGETMMDLGVYVPPMLQTQTPVGSHTVHMREHTPPPVGEAVHVPPGMTRIFARPPSPQRMPPREPPAEQFVSRYATHADYPRGARVLPAGQSDVPPEAYVQHMFMHWMPQASPVAPVPGVEPRRQAEPIVVEDEPPHREAARPPSAAPVQTGDVPRRQEAPYYHMAPPGTEQDELARHFLQEPVFTSEEHRARYYSSPAALQGRGYTPYHPY
jgi:hypothetical protein